MAVNPNHQRAISFDVIDRHLGTNTAAARALRDSDPGTTNPVLLDDPEFAKLNPADQAKVLAAGAVLQNSPLSQKLPKLSRDYAEIAKRMDFLKLADPTLAGAIDAANQPFHTEAGTLRAHQLNNLPAEHLPAIREAFAKASADSKESIANLTTGVWAVTIGGAVGVGISAAALATGPIGLAAAMLFLVASGPTTISESYNIIDNLPRVADAEQPRWARALIKIGSIIRNGVFGA